MNSRTGSSDEGRVTSLWGRGRGVKGQSPEVNTCDPSRPLQSEGASREDLSRPRCQINYTKPRSDSQEEETEEVPDFDTLPRVYVERTLAIIKPDAVHKSEEIEDVILKEGFTILQKRRLQLTQEQCSNFYADQHGKAIFPRLIIFMSSGPIIALTLARTNAIAHWKSLMGQITDTESVETETKSLRAKYGTSELKNAFHGSDSFPAAEREIKFMFPNSVIEPTPSKESTQEYLSRYVNPTLLRGLTELCKHKPFNPCVWLADWLMKNSPNNPQICEGAIM